jgi:hypothetical protein
VTPQIEKLGDIKTGRDGGRGKKLKKRRGIK